MLSPVHRGLLRGVHVSRVEVELEILCLERSEGGLGDIKWHLPKRPEMPLSFLTGEVREGEAPTKGHWRENKPFIVS